MSVQGYLASLDAELGASLDDGIVAMPGYWARDDIADPGDADSVQRVDRRSAGDYAAVRGLVAEPDDGERHITTRIRRERPANHLLHF